jgi:hypothetical protein
MQARVEGIGDELDLVEAELTRGAIWRARSSARRMSRHAELIEPVRNLLHRGVAHEANSLSTALASFRSSVSKPSVNQL